MTGTKKFATVAETKKAKALAKTASNTPVMAFSSEHAMRGGMSGDAWSMVYDYVNKIAAKHGLKDFGGNWGLNLETREFMKP